MKKSNVLVATALLIFLGSKPAHAYIGPGAGFALLSSFAIMFAAFALALLSLISWPFRAALRKLRRNKARGRAEVESLVILGLDGFDPDMAEALMKQGKLPNLSRLAETGSFRRLETTFPALSPVAWSSFATGTNPARHNIYDFLKSNPQTYSPELSSSSIGHSRRRLSIGRYSVPLGRPAIRLLRKSKPFWRILGEHGIFSHIIRVPITFPPEKFNGVALASMCAPDLRGTQGTFTFYTTDRERAGRDQTGGCLVPVSLDAKGQVRAELIGPDDPLSRSKKAIALPFTVTLSGRDKTARLEICGQRIELREGEFSPWVKLTFRGSLGLRIRGICQFYLKRISPHFELYVSPINIDPEKPALPISHPFFYSVYLAKLHGSYATLGMAEDTWALNEGVLDEDAFLKQAAAIRRERERMFFHALDKNGKGLCVCVFDDTDRIQHMFYRYLVDGHPANRNKEARAYERVIEDLYRQADDLVGKVMARIDNDTVLMVLSDHGFESFCRGVNLNSWLLENGFLYLKENGPRRKTLQDVDWARTKAYALGLGGIYINRKGRERFGSVAPGREARRIKDEIIAGLSGLRDPESGEIAINEVFDSERIYNGPYLEAAPDLIVGYNAGYRVSWDSAVGKISERVFEDNTKCWSGDHCIDPRLVPGVLFCNRKISAERPSLIDIAPTVLALFGIEPPSHMDGRAFALDRPEGVLEEAGRAPELIAR